MRRETTIFLDPEALLRGTHVVSALCAFAAFPTPYPRIHDTLITDFHPDHVRTFCSNDAKYFVTGCNRQGHASFGEVEALATSQFIVSFPEMQIRVTDTTVSDLDDYLSAFRGGHLAFNLLQWLAMLDNGPCFHLARVDLGFAKYCFAPVANDIYCLTLKMLPNALVIQLEVPLILLSASASKWIH